jgi:CRISPR system Cascade subunit CasA
MSKGVYNLLHEKWILAADFENKVEMFSILEIFKKAHKLKNLAGELPTQDIAILRLLLSVLHTVFYRCSPNGEENELESQQEATERWRELWEAGELPHSLIEEYLISYENRFYLFHPKYPFMQVKSENGFWTSDGKKIAVSEKELNYFVGEIAESGNKENLFLSRKRNSELPCDEAARWLIHLNSFDLSPSGRPPNNEVKIKGYGSAWLANLGLVYLQGETLFETMMLNLVLGPEDEDDYWDEKPMWEDETEIDGSILQTIDVPLPRTLNKLYSMRFRFIELLPSEDKKAVTSVKIWSGCKFVDENQFIEPMTVWRKDKGNFKPKSHSPKKRAWQDFAALLIRHQKDTRRPGVLDWIQVLKDDGVEGIGFIEVKTTGYETKNNSAIKDVFSDGFSIHAELIRRAEEGVWLLRISDEVATIEKLVEEAGWLAKDLGIAKGDINGGYKDRDKAKEQAYSRLDIPFRQWLEHINPETDDVDEKCKAWREEAKNIIKQLGDELVEQAGPQALVGRYKDDKWYTAARAHIQFLSRVKKI